MLRTLLKSVREYRNSSLICPVIILDEATSSIDTRTEKLIEQGIED